jgi:hypothetical protein
MIGTSAILQEEYSDHYVIPQTQFFREEKKEEVLGFADVKLSITDSETGRPISKAMVSIDARGRTSVCDSQGQALIRQVISGDITVDVIVHGYSANSTRVHLSAQQSNVLNIKMVRNC